METFIYTKRFHTPVYRTVMPSGAEVWTCPLASRMVSIETVFPFGAMEDGEHKGIAHFLEHLMLKGPDADGIHPLLRPLIRKGCTHNAATGWWNMRFQQFGLAENLSEMLIAMSGILKTASFTAKQVDLEREVILTEIAQHEARYHWLAWLYPRAYPDMFGVFSPMGGTPSSVRAISYHDVLRHAERYISFCQAQYVAAGNLTHEQHLEHIVNLYPETMKLGERRVVKKAAQYVNPNGTYIGSERSKTLLKFYYHQPADWVESIYLFLAIQALVEYPSGLLMERLRNQLRIAYSLHASRHAWPLSGACIKIPLMPRDFDIVQQATLEVLREFLKSGLTADALDRFILRQRINLAVREEGFSRARAVSKMYEMWSEGETEDTDYEALLFSATPKRVHEACLKYLDPDKMGIVKCVRPDT